MADATFTFDRSLATAPTAARGPKDLQGTRHLLQFRPNTRANDGAGAWVADLRQSDGELLDAGRKLIISDDLYADVKDDDARIPQGRVVVRRTDGAESDPGLLGIGVDFVVEYFNAASG